MAPRRKRWNRPKAFRPRTGGTLETIWFIFVALMVTMYVLLDGFDLGAGAVHLFAARNDRERRTIIRAIGPVWDINDPMWASFWDAAFFVGSSLLAVFYGAALGNVVRGVPLDESEYFFQPLWTDFSPFSGTPGILDWHTVLIGLLALTTLVVHGSNFIAVKTEDDLNARSRRIARRS